MKVAVLSESPVDEAVVLILVEGLLGGGIEPVDSPSPKTRGWRSVLTSLKATLAYLHYRTDADALVVTLDSDESPIRQKGHDLAGGADSKCRLCRARRAVADAQRGLRARQGRGPIKTAVGLAVPAIEAWCLAGSDPHVTESAWIQALQTGKPPYTKSSLKERLCGVARPSQPLSLERATECAKRLVSEGKLDLLEKRFPSGFGALANGVRSW